MTTPTGTVLTVGLEEAGARSWWRRVLATLASPGGGAYLRFVALADGRVRYRSATFAAPRTPGDLPPREEWAPGMTKALDELVAEIESDGWVEVGRGAHPWSVRYGRAGKRA